MNSLCFQDQINRQAFLRSAGGLGAAALSTLLLPDQTRADTTMIPGLPHLVPKARRIIYLFQSGAPSQMDLFDPKPQMQDRRGENLPESVRKGQR